MVGLEQKRLGAKRYCSLAQCRKHLYVCAEQKHHSDHRRVTQLVFGIKPLVSVLLLLVGKQWTMSSEFWITLPCIDARRKLTKTAKGKPSSKF